MAGRATRLSREGAAAFPTSRINFGLFFFFFKFKNFFLCDSPWLALQDFIFVHQEGGFSRKPYRAVPVYLGHFGNLQRQWAELVQH